MTRTLPVLMVLLAGTYQTPAESPADGGTLSVRVIERGAETPVPRATVTLRNAQTNAAALTIADAEGHVEFRRVRPGMYRVEAGPPEYVATHLVNRSGVAFSIGPGEMRRHTIALQRAHAISGRVLDQAGLPLSGVRIEVRGARGDAVFSGSRFTDDLGHFRAFGISPGDFKVCAHSLRSESFDPPPTTRHPVFVTTCYPSSSEADASAITVSDGDVTGIDIRMRRSHVYAISGIVLDAGGDPVQNASLGLTALERNGSRGTSRTMQGAPFTISNLTAGRYVLAAWVGDPERRSDAQRPQYAALPIDITSEDIGGIVLRLKAGVRVHGQVVFEDGVTPDGVMENVRVEIFRAGRLSRSSWPGGRSQPAPLASDLTFEVADVFGPVVVSLTGLPRRMAVKTVRWGQRDITGRPVDLDGDERYPVRIVVTSRLAEIRGTVFGDRGQAHEQAIIYAIPADPQRWMAGGRPSDFVYANANGGYRHEFLAPGEYLVVALTPEAADQIRDMDPDDTSLFERISAVAERVTLLDNDRRTVDLTIRHLPPSR